VESSSARSGEADIAAVQWLLTQQQWINTRWPHILGACQAQILPGVWNEMTLESKQRNRYHLLRKLYEQSGGSERVNINFFDLAKKEGLSEEDARDIHDYLWREKLIGDRRAGGGVAISHRGIIEIEQSISNPQRPTEHFPLTIFQHFNAPIYGGIQTGGQHNVQHNTISIDPSFDDAVAKLTALLQEAALPDLHKEEAIISLQRVHQLAQKEKSSEVIKLAKDKLDIVKNVIDTGKGLAEITMPYLQAIVAYFS